MLQNNLIQVIDENQIKQIAQRIANLRVEAKISSQEMADCIGLGYEQYRRIERGIVLPKTEHINAIVQVLEVSVDYILYGETGIIKIEKISKIINGLSKEELERAEKILVAAFG